MADEEVSETTEVEESNSPVESYLSSEDSKPSGNPAWRELLEAVPAGLHDVITPHLEKWDRGYQELATKSAAYKNVDLDRYNTGNQILDMLDKDPVTFFNRLETQLVQDGKMTAREAKAAVQELKNEQASQDQADDNDAYTDPEILAVKRQQEALAEEQRKFTEYMQSQVQQVEHQNFTRHLDSEIVRLRGQHGVFDEEAVLERVLNQLNGGAGINVQKAFDDHQKYVDRIRNTPSAGSQAPFVTPSGGGLSSSGTPVDMTKLKGEELANYFKTKYDALTKG